MPFQTVATGSNGLLLTTDIAEAGTQKNIPYTAIAFGTLGGGSYTPVTDSTPLPVSNLSGGEAAYAAGKAEPTRRGTYRSKKAG